MNHQMEYVRRIGLQEPLAERLGAREGYYDVWSDEEQVVLIRSQPPNRLELGSVSNEERVRALMDIDALLTKAGYTSRNWSTIVDGVRGALIDAGKLKGDS